MYCCVIWVFLSRESLRSRAVARRGKRWLSDLKDDFRRMLRLKICHSVNKKNRPIFSKIGLSFCNALYHIRRAVPFWVLQLSARFKFSTYKQRLGFIDQVGQNPTEYYSITRLRGMLKPDGDRVPVNR